MRTGSWPREVRLFEAYLDWAESDNAAELRESGSSTDFANYLNNVVGKRLMKVYREAPAYWNRYTTSYNVPDFKPLSMYGLTEGQDLLPFDEGGEYKDSQISERVGPTMTVSTYGRLFSISRKALINDDLGLLRDTPGRLGRAAARTLNRSVVAALEGNGNAYDGTALFHADHSNLLSGALSESSLASAALLMNQQTDDNGNPIMVAADMLVIPGGLEITARRILNSVEITIQGAATTPAYGEGNANVMRGYVDYIVDRYFTDANDWYLFANPADAPVLGVGFLNGQREPQTMLKDPGMRLVLGGNDPYSMEFDTIEYKVRHEWGTAIIDWRGAVKSAVA
jgi:hypothetical protein